MPIPTTKEEYLSFLTLAGCFRIFIPNYGLIAKTPYDTAKGPLNELLPPNKPLCWSVEEPKKALREAPVLALTNLEKPFMLYTGKRQGIALGSLGQKSGPDLQVITYLSR